MGVDGPIDITADQYKTILSLLERHLPNTAAWVYGSRVKWTSRPQSDLDLVVFATPEQNHHVSDLREAFEESNLPFRVDLFVWDAVPEKFRKHIKRDHVALAVKDKRIVGLGWRETTLGHVVEFLSGGTPSRAQAAYWNGLVPWVSAKDMKRFRLRDTEDHVTAEGVANGTKLVPTGTVLLLVRGMTLLNELPVCITERPMMFNQDVKALRPLPGLDPDFLPYLVLGNKNRLLNLVDLAGHGTGRLNSEELKALNVQLPSEAEQRAIAHILGTLDDKIELNRRRNETLEAMARALFKSWFVDFDPVRAKMEGRDTGLPNHIADLFPDRLVDSKIGEIPEEWGVSPLDEIAIFQNGLALQKYRPQVKEKRLPVVKIAQLRSGKTDSGEWATSDIRPECIIDDGDVVFSWSGSLMVTVWCSGRAALNQHLFKVTSKRFPKWFFLHNVRSHLADFQTIAAGKATTMGHIKRHHLSEAKCIVPDSRLLDAADGPLAAMFERSVSANIQSRTLAALRDALLSKLVSGELRVKDAGMFFAGPS